MVDEGLAVAALYGALKPEGDGIKRTVVIVGKDGLVRYWKQGLPPDAELLTALA